MAQDILKGKVALVSGGATGIGFATAKLYLENGAKVVIAGRRQEQGETALATLRQISPDITFIQADVSKAADVKRLISETVRIHGSLDIAFNNAGIEGNFAPIDDMSEEDFDAIIDINLKGIWLSCKHEIEQFRKQGSGGVIVNTSSWLSVGAFPGSGAYSASKAALDALTRVLAVETASANIRVNNVRPGYIQTPMFDRFFPAGDEAKKEPVKKQAPIGRFAASAEIGELVLWLSSPASSFITGESILADGGLAIPGQRQ
ncbi:SDR family NAD(P)-dependent oxidoreductase [Chitinophaga pinensis]|uniref:Short-chain dehydrogenase/reductase SDR n=1 Tax=Chitinophaga pinensis (strain ATCC 43595 / DSM 2588 / LMG 13176 / NBRC 15968 / NCIMB 11800 / UQM 2034) TaxID=485918 RepID=A0A979GSB3_CHIPD|nr:glucose 1-dehydrogenase [Chitinophaga pinensis]ACU62947.1 short-chain dehydrogenase/reductase SDR [Chitinophaga pinensis DSM 2588]